jgi:hypothetical protein
MELNDVNKLPVGEQALVKYSTYQCVAYRTVEGQWRTAFGDRPLPAPDAIISRMNGDVSRPSPDSKKSS